MRLKSTNTITQWIFFLDKLQSTLSPNLDNRTFPLTKNRIFLVEHNSPMSEKFDSNVSTYRSWKDAKEAYIHTLMTQQRNPIF